jgi:hypothetical protein
MPRRDDSIFETLTEKAHGVRSCLDKKAHGVRSCLETFSVTQ